MDKETHTTETPIDVCSDLPRFFREVVVSVRQRRSYVTTSTAESYIANLLADHAHSGDEFREFDRPLTIQLAQALSAVGNERFARLRRVGDGVLYTTGFFGEYLESRGLDQAYFEELGARAYATAGRMLILDRSEQNGLFVELAEQFHMFVALVHDVAESLRVVAARTERALVQLYERWLNNGSEALAVALASHGLVPVRGTRTLQ